MPTDGQEVPVTPELVVYLSVLLFAALGSCVALIVKLSTATTLPALLVRPWRIPGVDFGLVCCGTFGVVLVVPSLTIVAIADTFSLSRDVPAEQQLLNLIALVTTGLSGLAVAFGIVRLFPELVAGKCPDGDTDSEPEAEAQGMRPLFGDARPSHLKAYALGAFLFLGTYPFVFMSAIIWAQFLELLKQVGIVDDLPAQVPIGVLTDANSIYETVIFVIAAVVLAPLAEELLFRAGLYRFLRGKVPLGLALVASGIVFGLIHLNLMALLPLCLLGVLLALAYEVTGSVRASIALHALFNLNTVIMVLLAGSLPA